MRGKTFCCDASRHMYENYYTKQNGGQASMPVFVGRKYQRGHGLAKIVGGLFSRYVILFAKNLGKRALSNVVKTGMEVADDVASGKTVKNAIKERGVAAIKRTLADTIRQSTSNIPSANVDNNNNNNKAKRLKQQAQQTSKRPKKKKKNKRLHGDIFD